MIDKHTGAGPANALLRPPQHCEPTSAKRAVPVRTRILAPAGWVPACRPRHSAAAAKWPRFPTPSHESTPQASYHNAPLPDATRRWNILLRVSASGGPRSRTADARHNAAHAYGDVPRRDRKATLRRVAIRASRNVSAAAARLGVAPASLLRWVGAGDCRRCSRRLRDRPRAASAPPAETSAESIL